MANPMAAPAPCADDRAYSPEEFTAWLIASCERQQVPLTITNPVVLATIATLLR